MIVRAVVVATGSKPREVTARCRTRLAREIAECRAVSGVCARGAGQVRGAAGACLRAEVEVISIGVASIPARVVVEPLVTGRAVLVARHWVHCYIRTCVPARRAGHGRAGAGGAGERWAFETEIAFGLGSRAGDRGHRAFWAEVAERAWFFGSDIRTLKASRA